MAQQRSVFSWALDLCLVTGESMIVDLIPEDGIIRSLSMEDEETLGQSLEKMCFYKLRRLGSFTRLKCDERTTPEILYVYVARSLRIASLAQMTRRQQQQQQHRNAKAAAVAAASNAAALNSSGSSSSNPSSAPTSSSSSTASTSTIRINLDSINAEVTNPTTGSTPVLAPTTISNLIPPNTPPPLMGISTPIIGIASSSLSTSSSTSSTGTPTAVPSSSHHHQPLQQQQPQTITPTKWFHVMIIQDLDKAPVRTLIALSEMLATRRISAPPPSSTISSTMGMPESLELPIGFVTVATSMNLPVPTPFYTVDSFSPGVAVRGGSSDDGAQNASTSASPRLIPSRLLQCFLLRIPILLPKSNAASAASSSNPATGSTPSNAAASGGAMMMTNAAAFMDHDLGSIHVSPLISRYLRDLITSVTSNPSVECGPPPRSLDALLLAVKANAALRRSRFAVPRDLNSFVIELLAHRLLLRAAGEEDQFHTYNHPVVAARNVVAHALNRMKPLR